MKIHPALRTSDGELLPWAMRNTSARIREGLVSFPGQPARLGGGSALSRRKWVHLNAAATAAGRTQNQGSKSRSAAWLAMGWYLGRISLGCADAGVRFVSSQADKAAGNACNSCMDRRLPVG